MQSNRQPGPRSFQVLATFAVLHVAALASLAFLASHYPLSSLLSGRALLWLGLNLLAHFSVIPATKSGVRLSISVGFTVSGAILVLFNPLVAATIVCLGTLDERDFRRSRRLRYTLSNRSMYFICAAAAALLFDALPDAPSSRPALLMAEVALMVLVYFTMNSLLAQGIVSVIDHSSPIRKYPLKRELLLGYLLQGFLSMALVLLARYQLVLVVLIVAPLAVFRVLLARLVDLRDFGEQLVQSFADALDLRDRDAAGHTRRVAILAQRIGRQMGLSRRELDEVYAAGLLHDLGKIGIPDSILKKPGRLDPDEWQTMRRHPELGADLLTPYKHLQNVTRIMRHQHERFDGGGYPGGLAGHEIPLGARIIAVADTVTVICDGRRYQPPRGAGEAIAEISRCAGSQFDPAVVEAFLAIDPEVMFEQSQVLPT